MKVVSVTQFLHLAFVQKATIYFIRQCFTVVACANVCGNSEIWKNSLFTLYSYTDLYKRDTIFI